MRKLARPVLFLAPIALLSLTCAAQQNDAASKLALARATYYTPTSKGLDSFECNASIDWKDLLTRFSGKPVPADNPSLTYLNTVRLTVTDDLHGDGALMWYAKTDPPADIKASVQQVRDGMQQMFTGFFQTWNAYMNGSMVPAADDTTTVTQVGDTYKLHGATGEMSVDEIYDRNFLLTEAHVSQPAMDVFAYPIYNDTPDGRIIASIHSTIRQPPTAPPVTVNISTTHAKVENFWLPAHLTFEVENVGTFVLDLSGCTVKTSPHSATKP